MTNSLKRDLEHIRQQLDILNQHKFIRLYNSAYKMLLFQFLRGVAFGLGSVIGATIVVSIVISLLAQIEFIPIIGEWSKDIIIEIQQDIAGRKALNDTE